MKKCSNLILFLLCAVIFIFCGCSTYRVIKDATDHEEGRLIMKDGTEYVGRVKMPNGKTKKLRMRTTDGPRLKCKTLRSVFWEYGRRPIPRLSLSLCAIHTTQ